MIAKHSLFKQKKSIFSKQELIEERIELLGDKIILELNLDDIEIHPQVRTFFDKKRIEELAHDINEQGLLHPITVMKHPQKVHTYILVVGGNRFKAFQLLNRPQIPAIIKPFTENNSEIKLVQLSENLHRSDLNPIEFANALTSIKAETHYTLEQIAKIVGRTIDSIKQYSRISKLSDKEKEFHIKQKSTKNDILKYLAKREKEKKEENKNQLTLFNLSNYQNPIAKTIDDLEKKIEAARLFIKSAEIELEKNKEKLNSQAQLL